MKIAKLLFLVPIFLFFCANSYAMDMGSNQPLMTHEHCGETHDNTVTSSEESTKETNSSHHMVDTKKECKSKACSMETCCIAPALQASADTSLDVYFTFSNLPVTVELLVLHGSKDTIYHPPIVLS